jgi:hydroxyacylglutathione hydrolase
MGLYIKQLLAGRDFATSDVFASRMANFVYLIGDSESHECLVVDPAWDVDGILNAIDKVGMRLTGVLVTHYHPDHIGGEIFGVNIAGLADLLAKRPVKVHANREEVEGITLVAGISASDVIAHSGGDRVEVGGVAITLLHTPGHTPGSQCFLAESCLVSGDTLFINGCGRVDLPGGNPDQMYHSLTQVLAKLPEQTALYPGHNYASQMQSTIGQEKTHNIYMNMTNRNDWLRLMGP